MIHEVPAPLEEASMLSSLRYLQIYPLAIAVCQLLGSSRVSGVGASIAYLDGLIGLQGQLQLPRQVQEASTALWT